MESILEVRILANHTQPTKSIRSKTVLRDAATGTLTTPQTFAVESPTKSPVTHATGSGTWEAPLLLQASTVLD